MDIEKINLCMKDEKNKKAAQQEYWKEVWNEYIEETSGYYNLLSVYDARVRLISEMNYRQRANMSGCEELGVRVRIGDICFIDFGMSYLNEAGFQHFGLVMKFCNNKAYVIPMSSNPASYHQAYAKENPKGKKHLMRLGKIEGMNKESVLFLNDAKWINTARIIDVKAHIDKRGELFMNIKKRMMECLK